MFTVYSLLQNIWNVVQCSLNDSTQAQADSVINSLAMSLQVVQTVLTSPQMTAVIERTAGTVNTVLDSEVVNSAVDSGSYVLNNRNFWFFVGTCHLGGRKHGKLSG